MLLLEMTTNRLRSKLMGLLRYHWTTSVVYSIGWWVHPEPPYLWQKKGKILLLALLSWPKQPSTQCCRWVLVNTMHGCKRYWMCRRWARCRDCWQSYNYRNRVYHSQFLSFLLIQFAWWRTSGWVVFCVDKNQLSHFPCKAHWRWILVESLCKQGPTWWATVEAMRVKVGTFLWMPH